MEQTVFLVPDQRPFEFDRIESELAARDDCVRDPREWPGGQWSFILHPDPSWRASILEALQKDARGSVMAGIVAVSPQGVLSLSFAWAPIEALATMRDLAQDLVDRYQPRILDSMARDRTEECAGRVDIFFPASLPGALSKG